VPDQVTAEQQSVERQTAEIADCFFELIGRIVGQAEQLAQALGIPSPFIKALHTLECPMAMKELGKRMHCDPSFVTLVTDMLEKRGLARREPSLTDRRIKNVVLTEDGVALKHTVEAEITARMPWNSALSEDERAQLLALIRKMLATAPTPAPATATATHATGSEPALDDGMQRQLASLLVGALHEHATHVNPDVPPASAGGGE
jgi:MarR family transcriptional regulator, organic hydroperoxide resistance regulator